VNVPGSFGPRAAIPRARRGMDDAYIRLERVYKMYSVATTGVAALGGVTLNIPEASFTALVGPSGAGKSSILNLIGGVETPTAGTVWVDGRDLQLLDDRERSAFRRDRIGFLWQGAAKNLVPYLTVAQNVELPLILSGAGAADSRLRAFELLDLLGLTARARFLPHVLSGGEQQRVALGVALANRPSVVLADEPTAEIDSRGAEAVIRLLREACESTGATVVMATHDLVAAASADITYRLIDGRLRAPASTAWVDATGRLTLPGQAAELGLIDADVEVEVEAGELRIRRPDAVQSPAGTAVIAGDRGPQEPSTPPARAPAAGVSGSAAPAAGGTVLLSSTGLGRTYGGGDEVGVTALADVSLTLSAGELVVLMGPSGSGKSTLLGLLAGLDQPDTGQVQWEGRLLADIEETELARTRATRFGVIFQGFGLFPSLSALENVVLPLLMAGRDPSAAAEIARAWLDRFGLGGRLDHRVNELSAGQQQRVAVARGIANGQTVVLADEPTAELDERSGTTVLEALHDVALRGGGVIVATHDPWVLQRADRVIVMRDGRIEAEGSPSQVAEHLTTD
jgi:ABC-type lipoprotein export system ATPase subunit